MDPLTTLTKTRPSRALKLTGRPVPTLNVDVHVSRNRKGHVDTSRSFHNHFFLAEPVTGLDAVVLVGLSSGASGEDGHRSIGASRTAYLYVAAYRPSSSNSRRFSAKAIAPPSHVLRKP